MQLMRNTQGPDRKMPSRGFTLVELIIFLIVLAAIGETFLISYRYLLEGAMMLPHVLQARLLAESEQEIFFGMTQQLAPADRTLICSAKKPPAVCPTIPALYTFSEQFTNQQTDPYTIYQSDISGYGHTVHLETQSW